MVLLVVAGAGLVLTSDWGVRVTPVATRAPGVAASPVDMSPLQTARALAPLAANLSFLECGNLYRFLGGGLPPSELGGRRKKLPVVMSGSQEQGGNKLPHRKQ